MQVTTVKLTIDGRPVEAPETATILTAARSAGIRIPTLCLPEGSEAAMRRHRPSCMICVVEIVGRSALAAACAAPVEDGIEVLTDSDPVRLSRRLSAEMLLSEHLGECEAPCQMACPVTWNIPAFMERLAAGDAKAAAALMRRELPLAGVLGELCSQGCRAACRVHRRGEGIEIRRLHGLLAETVEVDPPAKASDAARAAVIGSGPAALAAAATLAFAGLAPTVLTRGETPGGSLAGLDESDLPAAILDREIEHLKTAGVIFETNRSIAPADHVDLLKDYRAIVVATGESGDPAAANSAEAAVFMAGACRGHGGRLVRVVADGKAAALAAIAAVAGQAPPHRQAMVRYGDLSEAETDRLFARGNGRLTSPGPEALATIDDAVAEAGRCLLCGCTAAETCRLRAVATELGADTKRFPGARREMLRDDSHEKVVFEAHKCILCGACSAESARIGTGSAALAAQGRGIHSTVATAYRSELARELPAGSDVEALADICPTAAIQRRPTQAH